MVVSEYRSIRGNDKIIVHYCNICGTHYLNMEEAENCERYHKNNVPHSKNNDDVKLPNNQNNIMLSNKIVQVNEKHDHHNYNVIMYRALVRGAHRERIYELNVEASNIKEASAKIREKFQRHSGYTLKPIKKTYTTIMAF